MSVRPAGPDDEGHVAAFLEERGMRPIARLGELHDPVDDAAFIAEDESGNLVGVLTYRIDDSGCEVTALYTAVPWHGLGSALLEAVELSARTAGCDRLWLVTTNDNVDALRFYQRRGFRLTDLRQGAVERSRTSLKPSIPEIGDHGIPIRDELVLEKHL